MYRTPFRFSFILLIAALLFVGCDSNDSTDDPPLGPGDTVGGSSSAEISADGVADFSGNAYAVLANDGSFGILLFDGAYSAAVFAGAESFIVLARDSDDGLPARGSYDINNSDDGTDFYGGYFDGDSANPLAGTIIDAESGSLTITSVSSDEVAGSFTFTGTLIRGTTPTPNVTVTGTFDAVVLEESDFPDDV